MNQAQNKIPSYKTPELISSKASILERRPPSFKIHNRVINHGEIKLGNNFQFEETAESK